MSAILKARLVFEYVLDGDKKFEEVLSFIHKFKQTGDVQVAAGVETYTQPALGYATMNLGGVVVDEGTVVIQGVSSSVAGSELAIWEGADDSVDPVVSVRENEFAIFAVPNKALADLAPKIKIVGGSLNDTFTYAFWIFGA